MSQAISDKNSGHAEQSVIQEGMSAKFSVDLWVEFIAGFRAPPGRFQILRQLPPDRGEPSYRVKGEKEAFERVARESELRPWADRISD
ncbi:hypothetical protein [Azorhizobium sp. AG788]|uniref:hypothetical protein n=2 Tax=Azorhizobium TaxID=6 RepID=UPI00105F13CA|nr:hypothetical protein [Azorhizobium sp. AG788]